jgi:hypothetical protein
MKDLKGIPNAIEVGGDGGFFKFKSPVDGGELRVVASFGLGWDHVSVSRSNRCPNWPEMCFIKDTFFNDDEVVIQYHPRKEDYVNNHSYCLHMWRPHGVSIPTPPSIMVGDKILGTLV